MDLKESGHNQLIRHPWEQARAKVFQGIVQRLKSPQKILDIGSGDAWLAENLIDQLPIETSVTCVDKGYSDPKLRPQPRARMTFASEIPSNERFDIILLLDVLEHIEADQDFLKNVVNSHLAKDGYVVISVPTYQMLFCEHDRWLEHVRRYSPAQARALVRSSGLKIHDEGGLFHGLLFVRAAEKIKELIKGPSEQKGLSVWRGGVRLTDFVTKALMWDWRMGQTFQRLGLKLPGLSWWCVCQKD